MSNQIDDSGNNDTSGRNNRRGTGYNDNHGDSHVNMNRSGNGGCKPNYHYFGIIMPLNFGIPIFGLGL